MNPLGFGLPAHIVKFIRTLHGEKDLFLVCNIDKGCMQGGQIFLDPSDMNLSDHAGSGQVLHLQLDRHDPREH